MNYIEKLVHKKFLSSYVILLIDLFSSVISSFFAISLANMLYTAGSIGWNLTLYWLGVSFVISLLSFYLLKTHKTIIRHSTLHSMVKLAIVCIVKFFAILSLLAILAEDNIPALCWLALIIDLLLTFSTLVAVRISMTVAYSIVRSRYEKNPDCDVILIYGTREKSVAALTRLTNSTHYKVEGFLCYGNKLKDYKISEFPVLVFNDLQSLRRLQQEYRVDGILFTAEQDAKDEQERLISYCTELRMKIFITPTIDEAVGGKLMKQNIRKIKIEDLLGRDEIKINKLEIEGDFAGKVVMVTGAAGSIGSELCRQLAGLKVGKLILFDFSETPMHNLRLELEERYPDLDFVPIIGDVRQLPVLDYAFRTWRPQVVFHAAAYKHVPLMEENPFAAVFVNVVGSKNVADKCIEYDVEKMVMISTDKAVNPTNIMGCTKRLAEIYVQSLGMAIEQGKHKGITRFVTTRFGNVLGSNGSVIPRFREQIENGGPITVTHPEITRFFMTIPEACRLVMEAATISTGTQIVVFDMGRSVKIVNLARHMIELAGLVPDEDIKIEYTGLRPGEKLYEEVLSDKENTIPTNHEKIRIAKVREYDYDEAVNLVNELERLSRSVEVEQMVILMKKAVPEFISQNSEFERFDGGKLVSNN